MNSKSLSILACAALTVLSVSCSKEQVGGGVETGVSFSVEVPGAPATKAIGDGLTAKTLYYQVFDSDGKAIEGLGVQNTKLSNKTATVKFQLMKDQTYKFVFWAQTGADGYYTIDETDGLTKITANYTGKSANDENFDAFYAVEELTVTGPVTKSVTLKRPFAQMNIATAGKLEAGSASKDIDFGNATSAVTFKNIPTVFSPLSSDDVVDGTASVVFAAAVVPEGNITVAGKEYKYLSMNYVFAPKDGSVYDVTAELTVEGKTVPVSVPNVPLKRNWRTNIVGNLLLAGTQFKVIVDPAFVGDQIIVSDAAGFQQALSDAEDGQTIVLTNSISISQPTYVRDKSVTVDLSSNILSLGRDFFTTSSADEKSAGSVEMKNGTVKCLGTYSFRVRGASTLKFDNVNISSDKDTPIFIEHTAALEVKNSEITAKYYCITTNASNSNQNPTIVVDNCVLVGNDPIMVNVPCNLTVTGTKMTGSTHGAIVRGGTASFSDSSIILNYTDTDAAEVEDWPITSTNQTWGSGNNVKIAALTLGNRSSSYQYPTNVTLKNTKVLLEGSNAEHFPSMYAYANSGEGLGVTITYDDKCDFNSGKGIVYDSDNIVVNGNIIAK